LVHTLYSPSPVMRLFRDSQRQGSFIRGSYI
jgi:hypothetical protein